MLANKPQDPAAAAGAGAPTVRLPLLPRMAPTTAAATAGSAATHINWLAGPFLG